VRQNAAIFELFPALNYTIAKFPENFVNSSGIIAFTNIKTHQQTDSSLLITIPSSHRGRSAGDKIAIKNC